MLLNTFCGCLSLQAGVVVIAFSLIQIAIIILISNLHLIPEWPKCMAFVLVFFLFTLATGLIMIWAAYEESRHLCFCALALNVFLILLFAVGTGVSFMSEYSITDFVCIDDRCPESLWSAPLRYKTYANWNSTEDWSHHKVRRNGTTTRKPEATTGGPEATAGEPVNEELLLMDPVYVTKTTSFRPQPGREDTPGEPSTASQASTASTASPAPTAYQHVTVEDVVGTTIEEYYWWYFASTEEPEIHRYDIGSAFYIALSLFVINLIFFIFCAMVVFSYSQEIHRDSKLHVF